MKPRGSGSRRLWSDEQKTFGPLLWAQDKYRNYGFVIDSGADEYPGCHLKIQGFGHTLIVELPPIVKPFRRQMPLSNGGSYTEEFSREYGFNYQTGVIRFYYGRQTDDSISQQSKSFWMPWINLRRVRVTLFDRDVKEWAKFGPDSQIFEVSRSRDQCPRRVFEVLDYDGASVIASTYIEETEHHRGTGRWKWISLITRPLISRHLTISFDGEIGREKGSWKGGTLGGGIDVAPGEKHQQAFLRYCDDRGLICVRELPVATKPQGVAQ